MLIRRPSGTQLAEWMEKSGEHATIAFVLQKMRDIVGQQSVPVFPEVKRHAERVAPDGNRISLCYFGMRNDAG